MIPEPASGACAREGWGWGCKRLASWGIPYGARGLSMVQTLTIGERKHAHAPDPDSLSTWAVHLPSGAAIAVSVLHTVACACVR